MSYKDLESDIKAVLRIPSISNILEVACQSTGMGFAAIARVTHDTWVACATNDKIGFGLKSGDELKLETTICNEILEHRQIVVIDHVDEDPQYKDHHTPQLYGLQSYISVPIILRSGEFFGTLCAIDPNPAHVNNSQVINTFTLFTELIAFNLDAQAELDSSAKKLEEEKGNARIREEFIAMLGHDLRNPVTAISNAVQLQLRSDLDDRNLKLATIISDSSIRVRGLIDNMLDFAMGRLGGGINLNYQHEDDFEKQLKQVVTELELAWPDILIELSIDLCAPVRADYKRLAQLFSNLLGNSISHGDRTRPILVSVSNPGKEFQLSVSNFGKKIPENIMDELFKPFSRGKINPGREGLGLGLYISHEIAKAHGGKIEVSSDEEKTTFTLKIPC